MGLDCGGNRHLSLILWSVLLLPAWHSVGPPVPIEGGAGNILLYGANGTDQVEDTSAVAAALATGSVFIPRGTFIISNETVTVDNTEVWGTGPGSVLQFKGGSTGCMLSGDAYAVNFHNFRAYGGSTSDQKDVFAPASNRHALCLKSQVNSQITDVAVHGFADTAVNLTDTTHNRAAGHLRIRGLSVWDTWKSVYFLPNHAEFVHISDSTFSTCRYGLDVRSGNVFADGMMITDCGIGLNLVGTNIENNAHGRFSGSISHSTVAAVWCKDVTFGHTIVGSQIMAGDILLDTCTGVHIIDGEMGSNSNVTITGGGRNYIRNNSLTSRPTTITHTSDNTILQGNFLPDGGQVEAP